MKKKMIHSMGTLFGLALSFVVVSPAFSQKPESGSVVPPETLILENIPAIPASIAAAADRYTEFRAASFQSWHPKRREMLITTRFGNTSQVHRVKSPGADRYQLTFFSDPVGSASYEPKEGRYFVFSKDIGGGEFFQLYRYDFETGETTILTDGKSRHTRGAWSHAGDWLAYARVDSNDKGATTELRVMRPDKPDTARIVASVDGGGWAVTDWSPDDKTWIANEYLSVNETNLWLIDVKSGEKTLLTPKEKGKTAAYEGAKFSRDGKSLFVATDAASEFHQLVRMDLGSKKSTALTASIPWDVEDFDLSFDGKKIAFTANEDGESVLHLIESSTGKAMPAPKVPAGSIFGLEWNKNDRDLGFSATSARTGGDAYSLDVKTGEVERWTESETGGLNTQAFAEPELVHWKSFDGRNISGLLYTPPAKFTGARPVIVDIHGGPEGQSKPGFKGAANYFINELGVAVIFPNVRGSTGYGKSFSQLDNGFLREDTYKDIAALFDWIGARKDLDAGRIMVTGGSYGGHMTLAVATFYSDRIRCAVDVVGISNLATFLTNTSGYRRDLRRVEYGDERDPKMKEFLNKIAPLTNAEKIKKPMFVVQGLNDPRVPKSESDQIVATLKKSGVPVWYMIGKNEGHGFQKKANRDFQFYATVEFIREYLLK